MHKIATRALTAALALGLMGAALTSEAIASEACFTATDPIDLIDTGTNVFHGNLPDSSSYAGTFKAFIDGNGPFEVYCVEMTQPLCFPECFDQGPDVTSQEIIWILENHYPTVPGAPALPLDANKKAAAVQLAIWHFSDGLDISVGGTPPDVFDAARDIIAAALTATVPPTPTFVTVDPSSPICDPGDTVTVTICVNDQNNQPMDGVSVDIDITGANPGMTTVMTNALGKATYQYVGNNMGNDIITVTTSYTIPVGLTWIRSGCQTLIMGETCAGMTQAETSKMWDVGLPVEPTTWGRVKVRFGDSQ